MRSLFLLAFLCSLVLSALAADSTVFKDHYPAEGETGVPGDTIIWWYIPSYPDLDRYDLTVTALDVEAVDSGTIDSTHWSFSLSHDTLFLSRADRAIANYWDVTVIVSVLDSNHYGDTTHTDSFSFRTEGATGPFVAVSQDGYWLQGSASTGSDTILIGRPYGTSLYMIAPGVAAALIHSPFSDDSTERSLKIFKYPLTGIARGHNVYQFYGMTPESLYTDTARVILHYTQTDNGTPRGVFSR